MEKGKPCEFYIEPKQQRYRVPDGFHIIGRRLCPRNLSPEEENLAQPDGINSCPLYDVEICSRAFSEEAYCPTRSAKRPRLR